MSHAVPRWARRRVVGIEREFTVVGPDGAVDAGRAWPDLDVGVALDPGDPLARRAAWGGVVTVDGREAEAATPPVPLAPGCTRTAVELATAGRRHLADAFASHLPGHRLAGFSTHLSVEVPESRVCRVARLVAHRLAVPLMLVLDRADSPGLLVRPRHGRLEVGGEFAAGRQLQAALVVTIAVVRLAERATHDPVLRRRLPRPLGTVVPALERHGWYVDRRAHGVDLYADGRGARVPVTPRARRPVSSATVAAGDLLAAAWGLARPGVEDVLDAAELALGDDVAAGRIALPLEGPRDDDDPLVDLPVRDYAPRRRLGTTVTVEAASWHRAVVRLDGDRRTRWATLPGRHLDDWLDDLDGGCHDAWLVRTVGDRGSRRGPGRGVPDPARPPASPRYPAPRGSR